MESQRDRGEGGRGKGSAREGWGLGEWGKWRRRRGRDATLHEWRYGARRADWVQRKEDGGGGEDEVKRQVLQILLAKYWNDS